MPMVLNSDLTSIAEMGYKCGFLESMPWTADALVIRSLLSVSTLPALASGQSIPDGSGLLA